MSKEPEEYSVIDMRKAVDLERQRCIHIAGKAIEVLGWDADPVSVSKWIASRIASGEES